ncbi:integral membrane protein [Penicillium brasilianum]|uniref:Integral membrane protein n=1 Tax=Penicillium brasilianum TaxID=104259 RepID=A0A1S9REZ9_PENBI|nr:integral membrane protein [Penicillium brasilianum]
MGRNKQFRPGREPLSDHPSLTLRRSHVSGPFSFLNPTWARYAPTPAPGQTKPGTLAQEEEQQQQTPDTSAPPTPKEARSVEHLWRSRDNRKGRHALKVDYRAPTKETGYIVPPPTTTFRAVARGILRMATCAPIWDVSWLVAVTFTLGSVIWIINAFFVWLPLADPGTEFSGESLLGGGISACIGATVFEIGSVLLLLEAVNANQTGCFGWALETELSKVEKNHADRSVTKVKPSEDDCRHHHVNRRNLVGVGRLSSHQLSRGLSNGYTTSSSDGRSFRWWPSWTELRTHYFHELGFLASLVQFLAATIFWIAGFTGLPGIIDHMSQRVTNGVYWVPQIVGGTGFILSGLLFTLETQEKWYRPAFHVLGWYIGVWNFIGGIGFTLCGALGPASSASGVEYQATLATFWGSWAFMIGSTIQWYESLEKYPVEKKRSDDASIQSDV